MAKAKSSSASLTLESLQSCLESLMDIYSCSICLEVVRPDPVQCVNDHIVCRECTAGLTECPTCRRPFSVMKPSRHVSQVIEVLPKTCKHKNCHVLLKPGDDHEKYCGFKETTCKLCNRALPGQDIMTHLKKEHPNRQIFTGDERSYHYPNFNPDKFRKDISAFIVNGYFVWLTAVIKPKYKTFCLTCYLVPNSKPKDKIFYKISFSSQDSEFIRRIKINLDPDVDTSNENTIYVPWSSLPDYIDSENRLCFKAKLSTEPI